MRVLMTTDTVGGVWTFSQELASGLLERDCAVALLSLGREPTDEQHAWVAQMETRWGNSFQFVGTDVPLEWMQANSCAFEGALPVLTALAESFEPDVVQSNQFCFGALPLTAPIVITAHSDVLSWADECRDAPLENSVWLQNYRSLVSAGLDGAAAVVAPTQWMLRALNRNFQMPENAFVVANGRMLPGDAAQQRKLQAVTAGRLWDEAKGIEIVAHVQSPMPVLVAGETQCWAEAFSQALPQASFLGSLSQEALFGVFRESAVYVCTSRYEPFGLAPLEAALCGCAIVARDIPSLREVWGGGALYFSDAASLEHILRGLSADAELLGEAQARSFQRAQRYTRDAMTTGYLSVFEQLLAQGREPRRVA